MNPNNKAIFKIKMGDDLRRWSADASPPTFSAVFPTALPPVDLLRGSAGVHAHPTVCKVLDKTVQLFAIPREATVLRYQDDEGAANFLVACLCLPCFFYGQTAPDI